MAKGLRCCASSRNIRYTSRTRACRFSAVLRDCAALARAPYRRDGANPGDDESAVRSLPEAER
ncbi:UNVERIFIED_ORG: hypothetical protein M2348_004250 [Sphingomonas sp. R1F5B]